MSCFCHQALQPLRLSLPALNLSVFAAPPHAQLVLAVSDWLGARALPSAPWQPDPAWLALPLPTLKLDASAMATLSALAQLRAQVLALAGIDLLQPGSAVSFARLVVTLDAHVAALLAVRIDPLAWLRLAALNSAVANVQLALEAGLLPPAPALTLPMTSPGGLPMASWRSLLAAIGQLAPLLAVGTHLGIDMSVHFTAQLAAALRTLRGVALPSLDLSVMASLTAGLTAVASLRASLGIDPLEAGFAEVRAMVCLRLAALMPVLAASLRVSLQSPNLLAELLALLPKLPYCPTSLATPAVVSAALSINAQALAALNWQVPAADTILAVRVGLPSVAFAAQFQAALGVEAVLPSPCGGGCDAGGLMKEAVLF